MGIYECQSSLRSEAAYAKLDWLEILQTLKVLFDPVSIFQRGRHTNLGFQVERLAENMPYKCTGAGTLEGFSSTPQARFSIQG